MTKINYLHQCGIPPLPIFFPGLGDTTDTMEADINAQFESDAMLRSALANQRTSVNACAMAAHRAGMTHTVWTNPLTGKQAFVYARRATLEPGETLDDLINHMNIKPVLESYT